MTAYQLPSGPVVVGTDGSDSARTAIDLAVQEAAWHRRPLLILRALEWPHVDDAIDVWTQQPTEPSLREQAQLDVDAAAHQAQVAEPGTTIDSRVEVGGAAATLVHASHDAGLVVVGESGSSRLTSLVAGSVPVQVATHAAGPVIVVRGQAAPGGHVVVGVDGSPHSAVVLAFAFLEAGRRDAGVLAVRAWRHPIATGPGDLLPRVVEQHQAAVEAALAESLAPYLAAYPHLKVDQLAVRGHPTRALLDASTQGQLVVVGARGHGGFTGLLLGSVGLNLLHHAACPVAIVRG
jgi:nucleotide-binding universal stress UspA family protein